jgi:hypothetical protein
MPTNRVERPRPPKQQSLNGGPPAGEPSPLSDAQSKVLVDSVARASRVGLYLRTALFGVAIVAALLAIVYTWLRGDEMVGAILSRNRATDLLWEQMASLTLPVLLFVLLGVVSVVGAYVLQSRALDERERALDAIARIQREAEAGVSRARTLARLTEDDLTHLRREFTMQVAFGRASYWLSFSLVAMSAIYSLAAGDLDGYSVAFSAGGVVSYLLGVMFKVPSRVACSLAALSQRHLIVSGFAREIGIIEADAYRQISQARRLEGCDPKLRDVTTHAREIRKATNAAVKAIQENCKTDPEPPKASEDS